MRRVDKKHNWMNVWCRQLVLNGLVLLPVFLHLLYMHWRVCDLCVIVWEPGRLARALISVVFDTYCLALSSYLLTCGRKRAAMWLSFGLSWVWCAANIIYATYFDGYFSLSAFGESGTLADLNLWQYVTGAIQQSDALLLVTPLVQWLLLKQDCKKKVERQADMMSYLLPTCVVLAFFMFLKLCVYEHQLTFPNSKTLKQVTLMPDRFRLTANPVLTIFETGVLRGQLLPPFFYKESDAQISAAELQQVEHYLALKDKEGCNGDTLGSSPVKERKNIIFIIAESYLSCTANLKVGGKEVTPYLNQLRRDSTTCWNDSMRSNMCLGASSDGQFIYMTGLLPLKDKVTVTVVPHLTLMALPKLFKQQGYHTQISIPTEPTVWRQLDVNPVYGFDKMFSTKDTGGYWIEDGEMMQQASKCEGQLAQPFFHLILTLSAHGPYDEEQPELTKCKCCPKEFPTSYSPQYVNYLQRVHYMDHAIRSYIEGLKSRGLYDKSIICIASDHGWQGLPEYLPKDVDGDQLSFLMLNVRKGLKYRKCSIDQVDVFPTVMQYTGLNGYSSWHGLGHSILDEEHFRPSVNDSTWVISSYIINGNYFARNKNK